MSQSATTHTLPLPLTVDVSERGAVSIETDSRFIAMSPFSERARRLALDFGTGVHTLTDAETVRLMPASTLADLTEALA